MNESTDKTKMWRIGELAAATGFTVRALHHYEEIGLFAPTARSTADHRLYGSESVKQLYRISTLQQLGLSLRQVRLALAGDDTGVRALIADHLVVVEQRIANESRLRNRLLRLVDTFETSNDTMSDLVKILEAMNMTEATLERRIAILVYEDIEVAFEYLTRVFGFGPGEVTRDPDGNAVHGAIQAGDGEFWLHLESELYGLKSPNNLGGTTGTMAIMVDDVDAHHRQAVEAGANIRYEPVDQPYGYREYGAIDIEGHVWSFMKPLV